MMDLPRKQDKLQGPLWTRVCECTELEGEFHNHLYQLDVIIVRSIM